MDPSLDGITPAASASFVFPSKSIPPFTLPSADPSTSVLFSTSSPTSPVSSQPLEPSSSTPVEPSVYFPISPSSSGLPSFVPIESASASTANAQHTPSSLSSATATSSVDFSLSFDGDTTPFLTSNSETPSTSNPLFIPLSPSHSYTFGEPSISVDHTPIISSVSSLPVVPSSSSKMSSQTYWPTYTPPVFKEPYRSGENSMTPQQSREVRPSQSPSQSDVLAVPSAAVSSPSDIPESSPFPVSSSSPSLPALSLSVEPSHPGVLTQSYEPTKTPSVLDEPSRSYSPYWTPFSSNTLDPSFDITASPLIIPSSSQESNSPHSKEEPSLLTPDLTLSPNSLLSKEPDLESQSTSVLPSKIALGSAEVSQETESSSMHSVLISTSAPPSFSHNSPSSSFTTIFETSGAFPPESFSSVPSVTLWYTPTDPDYSSLAASAISSPEKIVPSDDIDTIPEPSVSPDVYSATPSFTPRGVGDRPKTTPSLWTPELFSLPPLFGSTSAMVSPSSPSVSIMFSTGDISPSENRFSPSFQRSPTFTSSPSITFPIVSEQTLPSSPTAPPTFESKNPIDETLGPSSPTVPSSSPSGLTSTSSSVSLSNDFSPLPTVAVEPPPSGTTLSAEPSSTPTATVSARETIVSQSSPSNSFSSGVYSTVEVAVSQGIGPSSSPLILPSLGLHSTSQSPAVSTSEPSFTAISSTSGAPERSDDLSISTYTTVSPDPRSSGTSTPDDQTFVSWAPEESGLASPPIISNPSVSASPVPSRLDTPGFTADASHSLEFLPSSISPDFSSQASFPVESMETSLTMTASVTETVWVTTTVPDESSSFDPGQTTQSVTSPALSFDPSVTVTLPSAPPTFETDYPTESYTPSAEQSDGYLISSYPTVSSEASQESSVIVSPSTSSTFEIPEFPSNTAIMTLSEPASVDETESPEPSSLTLMPSFSYHVTPSAEPFITSSFEASIDLSPSASYHSRPLGPSTTEPSTVTTQTPDFSASPSYSYDVPPFESSSSSAFSFTPSDQTSLEPTQSAEDNLGSTDEPRSSSSAIPSASTPHSEQETPFLNPESSPEESDSDGTGEGGSAASPSSKDVPRSPIPRPPSKSPTPSKGSGSREVPQGGGSSSPSNDNGSTNGSEPGGNNGLPLGVGGTSAVAIVSFIVILAVILVAYKTCAVIPNGSGFSIPSIFASSDDENASGEGSEFGFGPGAGDDSPWDQVWQNASDLPEGVQREGEAAAAQVGGQFAGLLKPGGSRVRPPQVITRLAIPGMFTTLSQLSPDTGSSVMSVTTGFSYDPTSQEGSRLNNNATLMENNATNGEEGKEKMDLDALAGAADAPKVDLLFVFDASGSLSWRDYRRVKEIITKPHGLIDEISRRAHDASRIGFIEYAYDSVVVSELDREKDSVRRRILSSFQGDANNWDEEGMYIYEVGSTDGGNVLRKVSSVVEQAGKSGKIEECSVGGSAGSVNVKEVPPAMNGMSREVHLALKWSRFEMLPPVANKRIQAQLQNTVRRRRVVIVNGGEFTKGGHSSGGVDAAAAESKEMERVGIRVITIGIGEDCEKELGKIGSRRHHVAVASVEEFEGAIERISRLVMAADNRNDGLFKLPGVGILKRRQRDDQNGGARKSRRKGTTNPIDMDAIQTISKGLPRRASELPPWYTDGLE